MAEKNSNRWVPILEAVRASGYSRGSLLRWIKDGTVRGELKEGRQTVWLGDALERAGAADQEGDAEYAETHSKAYQELVRALSLANKHNAELMSPFKEIVQVVLGENASLRAQIKTLDEQLHAMHERHEKTLSQEHERRLSERREERDQKRRDEMLHTLGQYLPAVMAGIGGHFGVAPMQESALVSAIALMSDTEFRNLVASGMVPAETIAVIDRIRATKKKQTNGTSTQQDNTPSG
jgi:hypothetical protein